MDISCGVHILQGHVSTHCKEVEKEGEIHPPVFAGHWCVICLSISGCYNFIVSTRTIAGLMVPIPAMVATLTMEEHGHSLGTFPPIFCGPSNSDVVYYPVVFLTDVFIVIGIPLLIIVAWSLHKV